MDRQKAVALPNAWTHPPAYPLTVHQREAIEVLTTAESMYAVISSLQVGDRVPEQCYILDYKDGTVPPWQVYSREQEDAFLLLVLIDLDSRRQASPAEPPEWIARRVHAHPGRLLASPIYLAGRQGAEPHAMLCDLVQQARAVAKEHRDRWQAQRRLA